MSSYLLLRNLLFFKRLFSGSKLKHKIIFGTEIGCCVNQMWHYSPGSVLKNIDNNFTNLIKSEQIENPTYGLTRTNETFVNGKDFPWEHWIKWNNIFKERFEEAHSKYKLNINDYKKYQMIKLNFGLMVGLNSSILKFLKTVDLRTGEDDQHLASEFFFIRPEMVILDYTQILLSNTGYKHSFRRCTSKTMNNTHYNVNFNDHLNDHDQYIDFNVYTREDIPEQGIMYGFDIQTLKYFFTYNNLVSYPSFIQSPGKDWNCYNELLYNSHIVMKKCVLIIIIWKKLKNIILEIL